MEDPLISCIIPVYNAEKYLGEAIESVLQQTYRPTEVIVVDDGSTDGTPSVVAQYENRVRSARQENAGPAAARNHGVRIAQGEFIAFLDADDLWHKDKLTRQIARFQERPELGLCFTHVQNFWVPEMQEEERKFQGHRFSKPLPGYGPPALLTRRRIFDTLGPFDATLCAGDDTDWFLKASEQGQVVELLPDVLVYRRLHQHNISRQSTSHEAMLDVIKSSLDRRRRGGKKAQAYTFPTLDHDKKS